MTHIEEYHSIIKNRQDNPLSDDEYGERHHIKPRSIYPELEHVPDNIVRLTAKEHFMAHYHLWLYYRDELHNNNWAGKMCCALVMMGRSPDLNNADIEELADKYE